MDTCKYTKLFPYMQVEQDKYYGGAPARSNLASYRHFSAAPHIGSDGVCKYCAINCAKIRLKINEAPVFQKIFFANFYL